MSLIVRRAAAPAHVIGQSAWCSSALSARNVQPLALHRATLPAIDPTHLQDTTGSTVGTHVYNAMGQMIQNKFSTINTELMFDEAGHLLGEYSPTNGALQS
jgi:hypothetical protein